MAGLKQFAAFLAICGVFVLLMAAGAIALQKWADTPVTCEAR
jgi:hypothetical protein